MKHRRRVPPLPDVPPPEPRPTRSWTLRIGIAVWLVTAALCLVLTEDWLPLGAWWRGAVPSPGARPATGASGTEAAREAAPLVPTFSGAVMVPPSVAGLDRVTRQIDRVDPEPSGAPPPAVGPASSAGPTAPPSTTCEGAIAAHRARAMAPDSDAPPQITSGRHQPALDNGSYFSHCVVPDHTKLHVCAAVQQGRAVGVTVRTVPDDPLLGRCVSEAVRELEFRSEPQLDVTESEF